MRVNPRQYCVEQQNINAAIYDVEDDEVAASLFVDYTTTGTCLITFTSAYCLIDGRRMTIKDSGLNASEYPITIATEGAETIDGEATQEISVNGASITVEVYDGNLYVI